MDENSFTFGVLVGGIAALILVYISYIISCYLHGDYDE